MSFIVDKIVEAFSVAFAADNALKANVPGGIWHRKAASGEAGGPGSPYAVIAVRSGPKEGQSDLTATQVFTVSIRIYGTQETDLAGPIADHLDAFSFAPSLLVGIPARVLLVTPVNEEIDIDPEEKQGQDVMMASRSWSLLLHVALAKPTT